MTTNRPVVKRQSIGPAIRTMRHEQGLTLEDLSARAGLSASHLSRMERNQTLPSFTVLASIARVLGVSIDHFAKLEQEISVRDAQLRAALRANRWSDDEMEAVMESDEFVKQALHRTFVAPDGWR